MANMELQMNPQMEQIHGEIRDTMRALANGFQKLDKIKDSNRQSKQLEDLTGKMRECKRLIKELDREIKDEESNNPREITKQLNDEKQSMIKELNSYVALRKTYMSSLGNKRVELFDMGAGGIEPTADENVQVTSEMSNQELIDAGTKRIDETDQAIERSKQVVHQTVEVGTQTATTLKGQTEKILLPSIHSAFLPFKQLFTEPPICIPSILFSDNFSSSCSDSILTEREQLITIDEAEGSILPNNKNSREKELALSPISQSQTQEDQSFSTLQLDHILSAIFSLKESVAQLKTEHFLSTDSVSRVKSSLETNLKQVSSNISELISNLDKKHSKTAMHIVKTQDLLAQRIDAMNTTFSSRFDSVENKLSELTDQLSAVLSHISKSSTQEIAKKGEEEEKEKHKQDRRPTELRKRRDTSRHDKGPAEKRQRL